MRRVLVFCIYMLSVTIVCFAQFNQTESLTITTYYPAPYGVFKNLQLSPSYSEPSGSNGPNPAWAGTLLFNHSEQKPYLHNGTTWNKMGSAPVRYYAADLVSPSQCSGVISSETYNKDQLCSGPWYEDVKFGVPFTNKVHVIVMLKSVPDDFYSPCAANVTDQYIGYPESIDTKGFRLWASGSVLTGKSDSRQTCSNSTNRTKYDNWYTRATASYFAISE